MLEEAIEKLAIAEQFAHNSQYAGVARQAVADGYSAIDAVFSAVLLQDGETPPRNHKAKLDRVKAQHPSIFDARTENFKNGMSHMPGLEWGIVEQYYSEWLESRYESFEMSAGQARGRVGTAKIALYLATHYLAEHAGDNFSQIQDRVARSAFGYSLSETQKAVGMAHDYLFSEAEQLGERLGRKLGIKMASATNFCDADFIASDEITREIIETDDEIADHAAQVYIGFVRLAEELREKRRHRLADNPAEITADDLNRATDFMFSLKAKYHGERLDESAASIASTLGMVIARDLGTSTDGEEAVATDATDPSQD